MVSPSMRDARRAATAAAVGGGGLAAGGVLAWGVMKTEIRLARKAIGPRRSSPPYADGRYRPLSDSAKLASGTSLRLAVLGDSAAAGLGCDDRHETPGALLASQLADASGRDVVLSVVAESGAESPWLAAQVERALAVRPDVAIIIIGGNDITHRIPRAVSTAALSAAVTALRDVGALVVVGTCPDLGTIRPLMEPLRSYARIASRRLASAQTVATVEAGGVAVSLGHILGPEFEAMPEHLFSADRFHPSPWGYARVVACLLPSVLSGLGIAAVAETSVVARGTSTELVPLWRAASLANNVPGTEVSPDLEATVERAGRPHLPRRSAAVAAVTRRLRRPAAAPVPSSHEVVTPKDGSPDPIATES